jgi:hypothetical protein
MRVRQSPPRATPRPDGRWSHPHAPARQPQLLMGIPALQTDFITRDALSAAVLAWSVAKHRPLEDILGDQGALDPAYCDLLRPMVDLYIASHGGAEQSLQAISRASDVASDLKRAIADTEVQASLGQVGRGHREATVPTQQPGPDEQTRSRPRQRRPPRRLRRPRYRPRRCSNRRPHRGCSGR